MTGTIARQITWWQASRKLESISKLIGSNFDGIQISQKKMEEDEEVFPTGNVKHRNSNHRIDILLFTLFAPIHIQPKGIQYIILSKQLATICTAHTHIYSRSQQINGCPCTLREIMRTKCDKKMEWKQSMERTDSCYFSITQCVWTIAVACKSLMPGKCLHNYWSKCKFKNRKKCKFARNSKLNWI